MLFNFRMSRLRTYQSFIETFFIRDRRQYSIYSKVFGSFSGKMQQILVYSGLGAYEDASAILHRALQDLVDASQYSVNYVSPEQIIDGKLADSVALLAVGGGYDLGLIKALGHSGMTNIRNFVGSGGSYLGFCSGAYFACDRIEFDKGAPLEVVGERHLKFFPGCGIGPVFKPYDYNSRSGAVAANIDFHLLHTPDTRPEEGIPQHSRNLPNGQVVNSNKHTHLMDTRTGSSTNGLTCTDEQCTKESKENAASFNDCLTSPQGNVKNKCMNGELKNGLTENHSQLHCHVYFNGGCYFDVESNHHTVKVVSRYMDLSNQPPAIVKCNYGKGVAILSGPHLEYDAQDIDDGDVLVKDIVPELRKSAVKKHVIMKCLLKNMNIILKK